jgi:hypothetical protein
MLAEMHILISARDVRVVLKRSEKTVEDEVWKFERPISSTEARNLIDAAFHDAYDLIQYAVHGDDP